MKAILTGMIILGCSLITRAQVPEADSLKRMLSVMQEDSGRIALLKRLSQVYRLSNPDTSILLAKQGLEIARQAGLAISEAECLNSMGNVFLVYGNYPEALRTYLQSLKIFEQQNHVKGIGVCTANIALIYVEQSDYRQALSYYFKSKAIFDTTKADARLIVNLLNIGDTYEKLNLLDSALHFTQAGYELAQQTHNMDYTGMALNNLGNIHAKMQHPPLAMEYYRLSIPYALEIEDNYSLGETYLAMAKQFDSTGEADSSLHYARLALQMGRSISGEKFIKNAAEFLAASFEKQQKIDSAFYYSKIAIASRDQLFSEEKIKQVQALKFNEQLRQQEIAEIKASAEKERKNNLQLLMIAIFITVFGLFIILLVRKQTKSRFVEFMALIGLLLLFEFISLFIHPYIGELTHHTPVLMLLILVSLASVLVPAHHYLVELVKEKLAHKIILLPDASTVQMD